MRTMFLASWNNLNDNTGGQQLFTDEDIAERWIESKIPAEWKTTEDYDLVITSHSRTPDIDLKESAG